jgi:hypothetical protein
MSECQYRSKYWTGKAGSKPVANRFVGRGQQERSVGRNVRVSSSSAIVYTAVGTDQRGDVGGVGIDAIRRHTRRTLGEIVRDGFGLVGRRRKVIRDYVVVSL